MNRFFKVLFGFIILLGVSTTTLLQFHQLTQNNPLYFHKKYNNVTFLGTHNSYSSKPEFADGVLNQFSNITAQLEGGVGMVDLEIHRSEEQNPLSSKLMVCHGPLVFSSITGSTTLLYQLQHIRDWVVRNPERIITIYINFMGGLEKHKNANELVIADFVASGLNDRVWSYNIDTGPDFDDWPFLGDMVNKKKTVMVLGLNGIQNFKENQNYFQSDDGKWIPSWDAKTVKQVKQSTYWAFYPHPLDQKGRLYLMNAFASERSIIWDFPYLFGGNPNTAEKVNPLVPFILKENQKILKARGAFINFVWVDFWTLINFPSSLIKDGIFIS